MIHIINQYIWPDGSPVCLISEQLAVYLTEHQVPLTLVGGAGEYRPSSRVKPTIKFVNLTTVNRPRNTMVQILSEYISVFRTFRHYVRHHVTPGDTILVTSAPFLNVLLHRFVPRQSVTTLFWLFDYFPASIHSLKLPSLVYKSIRRWWDNELSHYDSVIKISANLGYWGTNAHIFRQWPMIDIAPDPSIIPQRKALYTGNLGIAHDVESLVRVCEQLREDNYEINFHADGPGLDKLPDWLKARSKGVFKNASDLIQALHEHEIHLVTGTPGTEELSFPSKTWNSIASGRRVIACGFTGAMKTEFERSIAADYARHLPDLANFLVEKAGLRPINPTRQTDLAPKHQL